jgi:hypothetical protein
MVLRNRGLEIKTPEQIELMRAAGLVVGETLELVRSTVRPGLTTAELDEVAETYIRDQGAIPSFQGVHGPPGAADFPASLCVSVNDEVVHGIPGDRVLADGDIVSIDCGAIVEGWHGDAAITLAIGEISPVAAELLRVCEESLWRGMACRPAWAGTSPTSRTRSRPTYGATGTGGCSRTTSGTASARRCTCRPTFPTSAAPARARSWCAGSRWPSSR